MKCFAGCGRDALDGKATCSVCPVLIGDGVARPSALAECKRGHILELGESDRQLVLMALAHLSVRFAGFDYALNLIALKIDNERDGRAVGFDGFRMLRLPLPTPAVAPARPMCPHCGSHYLTKLEFGGHYCTQCLRDYP